MTVKNRIYEDQYGPQVYRWVFTANDAGSPIQIPRKADKSVDISGTMGGGTITIVGSNAVPQGTGKVLNDVFNIPLVITTNDKLRQVMENPLWIWPICSGGAGHTITVDLIIKPST